MKPTSTFRLSKTTKRMMALMKGPDESRHQFRRMMIQAQLAASVSPKLGKDKDKLVD
jgi:hypothetical protein